MNQFFSTSSKCPDLTMRKTMIARTGTGLGRARFGLSGAGPCRANMLIMGLCMIERDSPGRREDMVACSTTGTLPMGLGLGEGMRFA